jgi:hypothetical protein
MNDKLTVATDKARQMLCLYKNAHQCLLDALQSVADKMNYIDQVMIGTSSPAHLHEFIEMRNSFMKTDRQIQESINNLQMICEENSGSSQQIKHTAPQQLTPSSPSCCSDNIDVFISYNSEEKDVACQVLTALKGNGISCWMAPDSIPSGSDYASEIQSALESCYVFVLMLSEKSQKSKWVAKELDQALSLDKIILPFHIDQSIISKAFNFRLTNVQRIEAYGKISECLEVLVRRILNLKNK